MIKCYVICSEDKKEEEVKTDKKVKTSDDEVIRLNKSLLDWCKAHLEKDPVCDFRPVFDDYKKHMDKIDKVSSAEIWPKPIFLPIF